MRRFPALLALLVVSLLLACSGPSSEPDRKEIAWNTEVPQSTELAGQKMTEEASGPWTVRKTASSSADARGRRGASGSAWGADSAPADKKLDLEAGSPAESGGAVPPPASAAPGADPASGGWDRGDDAHDDPAKTAPARLESTLEDELVRETRDSDGRPSPRNSASAPALKAGTTDDNEQYGDFMKFLAEWGDREDTAGLYDELDVADRKYIQVVNGAGKVVPAARVQVVDVANDRVALAATTYGDGRVPFYPHLGVEPTTYVDSTPAKYLVEVNAGLSRRRMEWDGRADLTVKVEVEKPIRDPVMLDVLFLIDTTGSMGDEIERIKNSLLSMTDKLKSMEREFDLRYAAVLYRDVGDEYVTMAHPFTGDIRAFAEALSTIKASGGGDGPESLNQGMAEAVGRADWREGAAKVMFLIADAQPHMDYAGDIPYGESLKAALAEGIRIHSVAASGLPPVGSLVFRQIAQFTRGKFIFIEYGTVQATAKSHGVQGQVKSNNLDDILFTQIQEEVARWGR